MEQRGRVSDKMKILVTGGSGFLGKALCLRLHGLGHTVSYLSRSEAKELKALDIKWFQGDISNMSVVFSATKDQHAVFHTAALAGYWGKKEDFYLTNVIIILMKSDNKINQY